MHAALIHKRKEGVRACNFDLLGNTESPACTKNRVLVVAEAFLRMRYAYAPSRINGRK